MLGLREVTDDVGGGGDCGGCGSAEPAVPLIVFSVLMDFSPPYLFKEYFVNTNFLSIYLFVVLIFFSYITFLLLLLRVTHLPVSHVLWIRICHLLAAAAALHPRVECGLHIQLHKSDCVG